jgi:serine phosphatase RsbU (regulator of sigma subunit)
VLVVGLAATTAFAVTARVTYDRNEVRLLHLRTEDASSLIAEALPAVETPLAAGVELAEATHDPGRFVTYMKTYADAPGAKMSVSLWTLEAGAARELAVYGFTPDLLPNTPLAAALLAKAESSGQLTVMKLHGPGLAHIGFAYSPPNTKYIAYEEQPLPANRQARVASSKAFSGLDYAIYLGNKPTWANLVATDEPRLPVPGLSASATIPFGNSSFILVMSPTGSLQGTFSEDLAWGILGIGGLLSLLAMFLVERLVRRRETAEHIAAALDAAAVENQRLYDEQRSIARTLQDALLPHDLPDLEGIEIAARYQAGEEGIEIGGDWYDVVALDGGQVLLVVGDVSGRGLRAATIMAELRFAMRAYAAEGASPAAILGRLSQLHSFETHGHFATVLCARLDPQAKSLELANAGHINPLLVTPASSELLEAPVGPPIGVAGPADAYEGLQVALADGGTLLAFTDGLVERRGQLIDVAIEQLKKAASASYDSLADMLDNVLDELGNDGFDDDTAILGVRWLK